MSDKTTSYAMETNASKDQLQFRTRLLEMFKDTPLPDEHLVSNFGLYMRSSVLVKTLVLNELYEQILTVPGVIMEFGTWWGQNLVMFENLRAIYEPLNKTRKVVGFDTFSGYASFSGKDRPGDVITTGGYAVTSNYRDYLKELLAVHEGNNVLGHIRDRHETVVGDVLETVPRYFQDHPETIVALAYFDLALYEPTKACLKAIRPHLIPGSVILLDEFTWSAAPGEAIAFKELFRDANYTIRRSRYTAERAVVVMK
jgi:hypothetical protein